ncbi:MAG: hypothetical protein AABN95_03395 [Acidobacteriota bacterium]
MTGQPIASVNMRYGVIACPHALGKATNARSAAKIVAIDRLTGVVRGFLLLQETGSASPLTEPQHDSEELQPQRGKAFP